jgi:hypothetical protein
MPIVSLQSSQETTSKLETLVFLKYFLINLNNIKLIYKYFTSYIFFYTLYIFYIKKL